MKTSANSNSFLLALSQSRSAAKPPTPIQALSAGLRGLSIIANQGDRRAWEAKLPVVQQLIEKVYQDPLKKLEAQVKIKELEWTLDLKSATSALEQSQVAERRAKEAELSGSVASEEMWSQAQKLKRLSLHWQERLKSKLLG